ncbi:MAG: phytanoyl-CoA dioxygenase family protein [Kiloniellales bacterium]
MSLTVFHRTAGSDEIVAALKRDGVAVLRDAVDEGLADAVTGELRPHFDAEGRETQNDFNGYKTLRLASILARSRSAAELIGHARILEILDPILLPHCITYRIGSCTGIEIWPDEAAQRLHRDDAIYPLRVPGVEWQVSVMWALTDFTLENGATRVIPGSHLWKEPRWPEEADVLQAPMGKGSALIYLGSIWHGGGANRSNRPRMGLVNTYSLGWLRQEENHYLSIPREVADGYPEPLRRLMGYQGHGRLLGWYPDNPDGY